MILYRLLSILLALACALPGVVGYLALPKAPALAAKLTRNRIGGTILGAILLAYCAYEGAAMLPGTRWAALFWGLVPIATFLGWRYLDFLTARAYAGALIVLANYAIQHAFAYDCACRPLYGCVALIWGCLGMAMLAWPWRLRDALEACAKNTKIRITTLAACTVSALLLAMLPFL